MFVFYYIPTFSTFTAGISDYAGGFWAAFIPLVLWGAAIAIVGGVCVMIFKFAQAGIDKAMHPDNNPMDLENIRQNDQIRWNPKQNWVKPGSIEDLSNKHYGYAGRQKEHIDRAILRHKNQPSGVSDHKGGIIPNEG